MKTSSVHTHFTSSIRHLSSSAPPIPTPGNCAALMTSQHLRFRRAALIPSRCRFKAAARLAHANISYGGEEQTAATAAAQRKLCSAVISGRSDAPRPAGPLI